MVQIVDMYLYSYRLPVRVDYSTDTGGDVDDLYVDVSDEEDDDETVYEPEFP